jgi:hypothetical protein
MVILFYFGVQLAQPTDLLPASFEQRALAGMEGGVLRGFEAEILDVQLPNRASTTPFRS